MPRVPTPHGPEPVHVTVTRYVDAHGRRCRKNTPGAVKQTTRTESYYAYLPSLEEGARPDCVPLGTSDKGAAWVRLGEVIKERTRQKEGLRDPALAQARKPLAEHLAEWLTSLEAGGRTNRKQRDLLDSRLKILFAIADWSRLPDVTLATAQAALGELQARRVAQMPRQHKGRGAQTRNHYHCHLRQFVLWCLEDGRLAANPIRKLKPVSVEADRRHDRRVPTEGEIRTLFDHLHGRQGKKPRLRKGMTGGQRALGYQVSMATGYRAGELASLAPESFDLLAGTVSVRASYSKRKRKDTQHLPAWLVLELRAWFDGGGGCWERFTENWPGRVLKADLLAAGVAYETPGPDGPLFFDFHALRHYYCSRMANQAGISPKTLMALCRHSTPTLTLKVYAKAQQQELKDAVAQLPDLGCGPGCARGPDEAGKGG